MGPWGNITSLFCFFYLGCFMNMTPELKRNNILQLLSAINVSTKQLIWRVLFNLWTNCSSSPNKTFSHVLRWDTLKMTLVHYIHIFKYHFFQSIYTAAIGKQCSFFSYIKCCKINNVHIKISIKVKWLKTREKRH